MLTRRKKGWEIPEREASPESVFDRRKFFRAAWLLGAGVAISRSKAGLGEPARRNAKYRLDRPLSKEEIVNSYNNYSEFGDEKTSAAIGAQRLSTRPWTLEICGLVERPFRIDADEIKKRFPLEQRLYRHRCVEAWSIAVPWIGFPLRSLVELAKPLSSARYLRTVSFKRPSEAPAQLKPWYPFPYFEGFRLNEATTDLAFVVTGAYGHELAKQNGSPISLRMPWKYGYKSPKAIVKLEFTERQPPTFWSSLQPFEYGFLSNVNPEVPHPRWSQAREKFFGPKGVEVRPTLPYNGYADFVAGMYDAASRRRVS